LTGGREGFIIGHGTQTPIREGVPSVIIYPIPADSRAKLLSALRSIGADLRSMAYFEPKREIHPLFVPGADFRAAAFLKQELLARGGDAVVSRGVISCEAQKSDVLLLGTPGQLRSLAEKLGALDCWGLPVIRNALKRALAGMETDSWAMPLDGGRSLHLGRKSLIMGILNLTGDSFYAGSRISDASAENIVSSAKKMIEDGASILDLGAESTRPGSLPVPEEEETMRLIPAVKAVRKELPGAVISADTCKAAVAAEAVKAGADIINDISGLGFDPALPGTVADSGALLVLSHIRGTPKDMQINPHYENTVEEILNYFEARLSMAEKAGIKMEKIILDPGLGFGKRYEDNLRILKHLDAFRIFGRPLLVGHSRKSFIGKALGLEKPEDRLEGTLGVTALCAAGGVSLVRVHDVKENHRVLSILNAVSEVES